VERVSRRESVAVAGWLILGILLWNGIYDMVLGQGLREYLFRAALHDAGRGPNMSIASVVDPYITDAVWIATFWSLLVVLAGMLTIRTLRARK
jgi:hypothetical protein